MGEQPTIIVISVRNYQREEPHVEVKYPSLTALRVDPQQDWMRHELRGEPHKISYINTLHNAGYRVYNIDRVSEHENIWYWRLKDE